MNSKQTTLHLYNVGVNYKKADTKVRGRFSISKKNQILLLEEAKARGFEGVFVLSTCNRTEIMGFAHHPYELISLIIEYSNGTTEDFYNVSSIHKGKEAVNHLFRTATGLNSQILGDYEIVGQLKMAFQQAKEIGTTNAYLERLFNTALQASKQVKNSTGISSGTTSVAYAAIQYITENIAHHSSKNILIYGLGKIGKNTCKNIIKYTNNDNVCLVNRTYEKAQNFQKELSKINIAKHSELTTKISESDILIVSTGAEKPTIEAEHLPKDKEIVILDLSIPENVNPEVQNHKNVTLINVDELSKITIKTIENRKQQIPSVEKIIAKHEAEFNQWVSHRKLAPAITNLKESLECIQHQEIDFLSKKIDGFDFDQAELLSNRIIQKITTQFVKYLKESDFPIDQNIHLVSEIFNNNEKKLNAVT